MSAIKSHAQGTAIEKAVSNISRVTFTLSAVAVYMLLTVYSMDDTSLLVRGSAVKLPILGVSVSIVAFSVAAPLLLVGLHLYLLLERYMLARRLRATVDWQNIWSTFLPSFLFRGFQGGSAGALWSWRVAMLAALSFGAIVVLPVTVILVLQYRFIAYHGAWISAFQFVVLAFDVAVSFYLIGATRRELASGIERLLRVRPARPQMILVSRIVGVVAVLGGALPLIIVGGDLYNGRQLRDHVEDGRNLLAIDLVESWSAGELYTPPLRRRQVRLLDSVERRIQDLLSITARGWASERLDLRRRDLRFADLSNSELIGVDLRGADLRFANLEGCILRGARLDPLTHRGRDRVTRLTGANLRGADLAGANLTRANLNEAVLSGADLSGSVLVGAKLDAIEARNANFVLADLRNASLVGADLFNSDLRGANLFGADLLMSRLSGASLDFARFTVLTEGVDLRGARLRGIRALTLRSVDARGSHADETLLGADLRYSDVRGVVVNAEETASIATEFLSYLEEKGLRERITGSALESHLESPIAEHRCDPSRLFTLGGDELPRQSGCSTDRNFPRIGAADFAAEQARLLHQLREMSPAACAALKARARGDWEPSDSVLLEQLRLLEARAAAARVAENASADEGDECALFGAPNAEEAPFVCRLTP